MAMTEANAGAPTEPAKAEAPASEAEAFGPHALCRRPLAWLTFNLLCGVVAGRYLPFGFSLAVPLLALLPPLLFLVRRRGAGEGGYRERGTAALLCFGAIACFAGFWRQEAHVAARRMAAEALPEYFDAVVEISRPPDPDFAAAETTATERWRCFGLVRRIDGKYCGGIPVRLAGRGKADFRRGDLLAGRAATERERPAAFPGAFDYGRYLETNGCAGAVRFVGGSGGYAVTRYGGVSPLRTLDGFRASAARSIAGSLPPRTAGFVIAILLGYRGGLDDELKGSFRNAGVSHLLAISGLHVGLVTCLAWWLAAFFTSDRRKLAAVALLVCGFYLCMSGWSVAAVRASLMGFVYLGGFLLCRRSDLVNSLALAVAALLLFNPATLVDLGAQLSFGAVLFISRLGAECERRGWFALSEETHSAPPWRRRRLRTGRWLLGLMVMSVSAWLGVWLLIADSFNQVTPGGFFANLAVIPLMSLALGCAVLVPAAGWLQLGWLAQALAAPSELLILLSEKFGSLPWASLAVHPPPQWLMLCYYGAFGLLFSRRLLEERARRWVGRACLAALLATPFAYWHCSGDAPAGESTLAALPEGAGEVLVLLGAGGEVTVAGDPERGGLDLAKYLHYRRRCRIDLLLVPDPGRDYAALAGHMRIAAVAALPEGEGERELPGGGRLLCRAGEDGKTAYTELRAGGTALGVYANCWPEQMLYRLRKSAGALPEVVFLHCRKKKRSPAFAAAAELLAETSAFADGAEAYPRGGVLSRDAVGAVELRRDACGETGSFAFDGAEWRSVLFAPRATEKKSQ